MSAPSSRSSNRFPSYSAGCAPLSASTARRPSRAHTAATHRQQLDCSVPHVIRVSALWASASPTRNSSLQILLPVSSSPVRSSRLTHSSTPSSAESRSSFRSGVGAYASSTRGIGGGARGLKNTISREKGAPQSKAPRAPPPRQPLHHHGASPPGNAGGVVVPDVDPLHPARGP